MREESGQKRYPRVTKTSSILNLVASIRSKGVCGVWECLFESVLRVWRVECSIASPEMYCSHHPGVKAFTSPPLPLLSGLRCILHRAPKWFGSHRQQRERRGGLGVMHACTNRFCNQQFVPCNSIDCTFTALTVWCIYFNMLNGTRVSGFQAYSEVQTLKKSFYS